MLNFECLKCGCEIFDPVVYEEHEMQDYEGVIVLLYTKCPICGQIEKVECDGV